MHSNSGPGEQGERKVSDQITEIAVLGGGCFWCVEAVFLEIAGVTAVTSGYSGGHTVNPNYYEVCSERTGHAEVARLEFDPSVVTFTEILELFFATRTQRLSTARGRTGAHDTARLFSTRPKPRSSRRRRLLRNWTRQKSTRTRSSRNSFPLRPSILPRESTSSSTRTTPAACTASL